MKTLEFIMEWSDRLSMKCFEYAVLFAVCFELSCGYEMFVVGEPVERLNFLSEVSIIVAGIFSLAMFLLLAVYGISHAIWKRAISAQR